MKPSSSAHEVLIVCYGNICRSPTGEYLMRQAFEKAALAQQYTVHSAGVRALVGKPAATGASQAAEAHGVSLASHEARQLTIEMAMQADTIIAMDEVVEEEILILTRDKVAVQLWPVNDPYGGPQPGYETAFQEILERVETWVRRAANSSAPGGS